MIHTAFGYYSSQRAIPSSSVLFPHISPDHSGSRHRLSTKHKADTQSPTPSSCRARDNNPRPQPRPRPRPPTARRLVSTLDHSRNTSRHARLPLRFHTRFPLPLPLPPTHQRSCPGHIRSSHHKSLDTRYTSPHPCPDLHGSLPPSHSYFTWSSSPFHHLSSITWPLPCALLLFLLETPRQQQRQQRASFLCTHPHTPTSPRGLFSPSSVAFGPGTRRPCPGTKFHPPPITHHPSPPLCPVLLGVTRHRLSTILPSSSVNNVDVLDHVHVHRVDLSRRS